jgi:hypothetical protein
MYQDYLKEREGIETLQIDCGFILYKMQPNGVLLISDIYIKPEFRGSRRCFALADAVINRAKSKGCKEVACQVDTAANGVAQSMAVILKYGFVPYGSENGLVYFTKGV